MRGLVLLGLLRQTSTAASPADERACFDRELAEEGDAAARRGRARDGVLDVLGARISVDCSIAVRPGNATLELRDFQGVSSYLDLRSPRPSRQPLLCELVQHGAARFDGEAALALLTSVGDAEYLWRYWRWMLNKHCWAALTRTPYYLWVGFPLQKRRTAPIPPELGAASCPAALEETWFSRQAFQQLQPHFLRRFVTSSRGAIVALPAPCYKQFFGAAVMVTKTSPWALGFTRRWYLLRCGPKDQPSLWHLVLRASGRRADADDVLAAYHDARCVDEAGSLTTKTCDARQCLNREDCGYFSAWASSTRIFKTLWQNGTRETPQLHEVRTTLRTPGGRIAYLPNSGVASNPLLCGDKPPVTHVKFLRKNDRDLDPRCPALPKAVSFSPGQGEARP